MQAFFNDQKIKDKYLKRVRDHRLADELVQGITWEDGKGCAVGCTLENYNHKQYEVELGIPEWLARVEDTIFEGLVKDEAMKWPERFLAAIKPGADLSKVEAPFVIFILESNLANFDHDKYPDVKAAIDECIRLYKIGDLAPSASWSAARSAAWSAARSAARSAAWSAARSASWSAARSAAWSAAGSAAWSAAYTKFADKLIELIEGKAGG
jgi:hypothetical protein